jgi:hypothetical protein
LEDEPLWKLWEQSREERFPKNFIRLLPVQDRKDEGSGDLLTWSLVHASDRTGVATAAAQ